MFLPYPNKMCYLTFTPQQPLDPKVRVKVGGRTQNQMFMAMKLEDT